MSKVFVKKITKLEYNSIQDFFDNAEQLERIRGQIFDTMVTAWDKKAAEIHRVSAEIIFNNIDEYSEDMIKEFRNKFDPIDLQFHPKFPIDALCHRLNSFSKLSGTTAYSRLQKLAHYK